MLYPFKHRGVALLGAALLFLVTLAPAAAWGGTYPGGYMMGTGGMSYGGRSVPYAMPGGMSTYGRSMGSNIYGPAMGYGGYGGYGGSSRYGTYGSYGSSSRYGTYGGYGNYSGYGSYGSALTRYRVRFGDTLDRIAARFRVSPAALLRANPVIFNPNLIFAGMILRIPAAYGKAYTSSGGYAAPSGGYTAPSGGYTAPSGGYTAPSGGYAAPAATATPMPMPAPAAQATPAPTQAPGGVTAMVQLTAHNLAFSTNTITVPAGAHVVVTFTNDDNGVPHNLAVYTDSSATSVIFQGPHITGPATTTYRFDAPGQPGTYFFRCDVHPTMMMGKFVVQ